MYTTRDEQMKKTIEMIVRRTKCQSAGHQRSFNDLRASRQPETKVFARTARFLLAASVASVITATISLHAALGDQSVVRDVVAAQGWTSIVPMNIDGHGPTDLVSYNAATGRAAFSIGTGKAGDQQVVRDVMAATGWTSIVPMDIDGNGLTDLLSYNAVTGRAAFSIGTGTTGDQQIVRDVMAATGWTSIVPMDINGHGPTDLVSYNAATGRAAFSIGTGTRGISRSSETSWPQQGGPRLCRWTSTVTVQPTWSRITQRLVGRHFQSGQGPRGISRSSETSWPQQGGPQSCRWTSTVTVEPTWSRITR